MNRSLGRNPGLTRSCAGKTAAAGEPCAPRGRPTLSSPAWKGHLEGPLGRATWKGHLEGPLGRATWKGRTMRRLVLVARVAALTLVVIVITVATASAAGACGSLVAANGAVNLVRTTTLVTYHDGVEHYVTSFEFSGAPKTFGSIIPLPDEPTKVERAGDWTL